MLSLFKPAPHIQRLSADRIDPVYRRLRWQIFIGIFFGYAAYYLVRKNFALAFPSLQSPLLMVFPNLSWDRFLTGLTRAIFSRPGLSLPRLSCLSWAFATGQPLPSGLWLFCCFSADGSRGWAGLRADVLWCTGGHRKSAAELYQSGTVPITSAAAYRRC